MANANATKLVLINRTVIVSFTLLFIQSAKVQEIIDVGALIQVNASSIIGKDGARAKKFIKKLIKNNMISFVSSDIHFKRINYMDLAYNYVVKKHTKEVADKIFEANAFEVLIKGIRERRN